MRIVLLGPPGSGKGTQARLLQEHLGVPQISTGDIFRKAIAEVTALGVEVEKYVSGGTLVPDPITIGLVRERLLQEDAAKGFVLDGFPRTIAQAAGVEEVSKEQGWELDAAINIQVPEDVLLRRLTLRQTCPACGMIYHLEGRPSVSQGMCDECGSALEARADDRKETVRNRLKVYFAQTSPLVDYFGRKSQLVNIDGSGRVEEVFGNICAALGDRSEYPGKGMDDKTENTARGSKNKGELRNSR